MVQLPEANLRACVELQCSTCVRCCKEALRPSSPQQHHLIVQQHNLILWLIIRTVFYHSWPFDLWDTSHHTHSSLLPCQIFVCSLSQLAFWCWSYCNSHQSHWPLTCDNRNVRSQLSWPLHSDHQNTICPEVLVNVCRQGERQMDDPDISCTQWRLWSGQRIKSDLSWPLLWMIKH